MTDPTTIPWVVEQQLTPPDAFRTPVQGPGHYRAVLVWDADHDRYELAPDGWAPITDDEEELLMKVDLYRVEDILHDMF